MIELPHGYRLSRRTDSTTEQAEGRREQRKADLGCQTVRRTPARDCSLKAPDGRAFHHGDELPRDVPTGVLRRAVAMEAVNEIDSDELQRRLDLPKASHVYARDMVTDGEHRRKDDPAFPEHLAIKARAAYSFARKSGEIVEVPAREAVDGTERFQALIESGRLIPNPNYQPPKRKRGAA